METMLHLLETFNTLGSDGHAYVVHGYEILGRLDAVPDVQGQWEPTGTAEYRLADGRRIHIGDHGQMTVADTGVTLERTEPRA